MIEKIDADLKAAMLAHEAQRVSTLRMLKAALTNAQIAARAELDEGQIMAVLQKEAKSRQDAAEAYESAGQPERAAAERAEQAIISSYLPTPLDQEELKDLVDAVIAQTGATSAQQMGVVMAALKPKVAGRADGAALAALVRDRLSSPDK
jgi:uncharacterized protein YqeY